MKYEPTVTTILAAGSLLLPFTVFGMLFAIESPWGSRVMAFVHKHAQRMTLGVALAATLGSLFYSDVAGFVPCEFCWYQRILMYPIALILLVGLITRQRVPVRYIVGLAAVGLPISIYHYQLQLFPEQATVCSEIVPCYVKELEKWGFITIPFMAGAAFLSILLLQAAEWRVDTLYRRWSESDDSPQPAARTAGTARGAIH